MIRRTAFLIATLAVTACSGTPRPAQPEVPPRPASTQAARTLPTLSLNPTPTPTPTLTALASPTPMPIADPPDQVAPPFTVARIEFGRDHSVTSNTVSLVDLRSEFRAGREIAWRVELPRSDGTEVVRLTVEDVVTGLLAIDDSFTPDAGWNIFYGKTILVYAPGEYVMRYFIDGQLAGEGSFVALAALSDASTPEPDRTPKPTPKPDRDCDPSYPTLCLPSYPDLDCGDINANDFPVRGRDPHGFDGDGDGIGCES